MKDAMNNSVKKIIGGRLRGPSQAAVFGLCCLAGPLSLSVYSADLRADEPSAVTVTGTPPATGITAAEIVSGVEAAYKDVQSLRADFVQVTRSAAMGEGEKQRGKVQLMRPRSMRWDFAAPDPKLFVTDGKTMWVYTPAEKQVFVSEDLGGGGDGGMDQLLGNLENLNEYFEVTVIDTAAGAARASYVLELSPKREVQFTKLRLELDRKNYTLRRLIIVDAFGSETDLGFSNVKLNPSLDSDDFTFVVPTGIAVVRADGL